MTIRTQSADGVTHEFPDGTPDEAVDKAMKEYAQRSLTEKLPPSEPSTTDEFIKGFMDPGMGGAQLLSHVVPGMPSAKADEVVKSRAKVPGQPDDGSFSAPRLLGNVVNPLNYLGVGAVAKLAPGAGPLARSVASGGVASLLQPTTDPDFWGSKSKQAAEGMALGFGFSMGGKAVSKGMEAIGDYLLRTHPEVLESKAVQLVLKRINQDAKGGGLSMQDALDLVEAANASGKPLTLADVGGKNIRGLSGTMARQPGASGQIAKKAMEGRDATAVDRLSADIDQYVHGGDSSYQTTQMLLNARSAAGTPAYDALDGVKGVWSPRLQQFFSHPEIQRGLNLGYQSERLKALANDRPFNPTALGVDLDAEGNIMFRQVPNMRVLDMAKQGLDAMIAKERDPLTGRLSKHGLDLEQVRRAYLGEIDALDTKGLYKKARNAWSGPSASLDALRAGRSIFGQSGEENAAIVGRLSDNDKEFYRMGVADLLKERMLKAGIGGDEAKALIKNEWMRKQLRPAFRSEEDFNKFIDAVATERLMFDAKTSIMKGSQTAERAAEDAGSVADMVNTRTGNLASNIVSGHWWSALVNSWRIYRDLGSRPDPKFNEAVSKLLFSPIQAGSDMSQRLRMPVMPRPRNVQAEFGQTLHQMGSPVGAGAASGLTADPQQAPDGNYYIPDPYRPGKYLQVVQ